MWRYDTSRWWCLRRGQMQHENLEYVEHAHCVHVAHWSRFVTSIAIGCRFGSCANAVGWIFLIIEDNIEISKTVFSSFIYAFMLGTRCKFFVYWHWCLFFLKCSYLFLNMCCQLQLQYATFHNGNVVTAVFFYPSLSTTFNYGNQPRGSQWQQLNRVIPSSNLVPHF